MSARSTVEPTRPDPGRYPNDLWLSLLAHSDLFACYERLFDVLEGARIPVDVLYSPGGDPGAPVFLPTDRVEVHRNLRGIYAPPPTNLEIEQVLSHPGCEYQSVLLHRGMRTDRRGFDHISDGRSGAFALIRDRSFVGRSVLDIGCALGDMLFRAERYGATRLLGVETKARRLSAAQAIAKLLRSNAIFRHADFLEMEFAERFDDVLVLNVLHHVSDFRAFLMKAAAAAKERLIVEFPTLRDGRFQSLMPFADEINHLPIVGVSSDKVEQTFVFSPAALERIVADAGRFSSVRRSSPIAGREVLIFHRENDGGA